MVNRDEIKAARAEGRGSAAARTIGKDATGGELLSLLKFGAHAICTAGMPTLPSATSARWPHWQQAGRTRRAQRCSVKPSEGKLRTHIESKGWATSAARSAYLISGAFRQRRRHSATTRQVQHDQSADRGEAEHETTPQGQLAARPVVVDFGVRSRPANESSAEIGRHMA